MGENNLLFQSTYSTCMTTNIHNIMFPIFLTSSTPNSFLRSLITKSLNTSYCCIHPLSPHKLCHSESTSWQIW